MAHTRQLSESDFHISMNWGQFVHLPLFLYWGLEFLKIYTEFEINRHKRNNAVTKLRISKVSNEVDIAMKWLIDALNDPMENILSNI